MAPEQLVSADLDRVAWRVPPYLDRVRGHHRIQGDRPHGLVMPLTKDVTLSHILVVKDLHRATRWYRDVLGAELYREYGGTTAVFDLNGAWLVIVTGGGPTPDKPQVTMVPPTDLQAVSHAMTLRVQDCRVTYAELRDRGARFLTEPVESEWEVRAFFHDPDGHLFEISEAKT